MEIHIGNRVAEVELVSKEDNKVVLTIDGKTFEADVVMAENGTCNILMDGRSSNAQLIRRDNGKSYKVNTHYSSFNVEIVDSQAKYLRMRKKGLFLPLSPEEAAALIVDARDVRYAVRLQKLLAQQGGAVAL